MLSEWLTQNFEGDTTGFRKCYLTFGHDYSFFVRSPKGCLWNNLPASLEKMILNQMKQGGSGPPKMVSLGAGGTWVATWDGKYYLWVLVNHYYDGVHEALKENNNDRSKGINYIAISPYEDTYFIHFNNGMINYNSALNSQPEQELRHIIYRYMQERARADKVTYRLLVGKDQKSVVISPTTSYEKYDSLVEVSSEDLSPQSWMSWLWKKIF
ncbi:hypothetical protein MMC17_006539 [Xylographa soralifera]|nr:hypothetical protein [Xylographa soralifera]